MTNIFYFNVNVSVVEQIFPAESTFRKFQKVSERILLFFYFNDKYFSFYCKRECI